MDSNLLLREPFPIFNCSAIGKNLEISKWDNKVGKTDGEKHLLTRLNCDPSKTWISIPNLEILYNLNF